MAKPLLPHSQASNVTLQSLLPLVCPTKKSPPNWICLWQASSRHFLLSAINLAELAEITLRLIYKKILLSMQNRYQGEPHRRHSVGFPFLYPIANPFGVLCISFWQKKGYVVLIHLKIGYIQNFAFRVVHRGEIF